MDVVQEIERLKPHHLRVLCEGESEPRRVAIPKRRNRWAAVARVLESLTWVEIECCDAQGGVLGVLRSEESSSISEVAAVGGDGGGVTLREAQLCDLVVAAQRQAVGQVLQAQAEARAAVLQQFDELGRALSLGVRQLADMASVQASWFQRQLEAAPSVMPQGEEGVVEALAPLVAAVLENEGKGKASAKVGATAPGKKK